MVVVHHLRSGNLGTLLGSAEVDVNLAAGTAGTGLAHFPEIIVLVAVDDMVGGKVLEPYLGSLVVPFETFLGGAFEHSGVEVLGVETEDVDEVFPSHVDSLFLEIVAEGPVSEHFEHGMMICVETYFFKVVVLAADAETLL